MIRNRKIGFIFQSFNLIPRTSALRNVELPLAYAGVRAAERRERRPGGAGRVGLSDRIEPPAAQLSGGQQQRVAVARAIVTEPVLLLADEPTGALDSHSTAEVLELFDALAAAGRTVVVITHEAEVADHAKRVIEMRDGLIVADARQAAVDEPPPLWPPGASSPVAVAHERRARSCGSRCAGVTANKTPLGADDARHPDRRRGRDHRWSPSAPGRARRSRTRSARWAATPSPITASSTAGGGWAAGGWWRRRRSQASPAARWPATPPARTGTKTREPPSSRIDDAQALADVQRTPQTCWGWRRW